MSRHALGNFHVCRHARSRMQGRAIRDRAVDLVMRYGSEERASGGRTLVRLDRDLQRELETAHRDVEGRLGIYVILAADVVVTVCHDTRRRRRRD
jgi:hypothetical protein